VTVFVWRRKQLLTGSGPQESNDDVAVVVEWGMMDVLHNEPMSLVDVVDGS
jgi:hypothetical protein